MNLKKGALIILVLLILVFLIKNNFQITSKTIADEEQTSHQCVMPNLENIPVIVGIMREVAAISDQNPLDVFNNWISEDSPWNPYRKEIEAAILHEGCIDDYTLNLPNDCWDQNALCTEGRCVKFEDMGWDDIVVENVLKLKDADVVERGSAVDMLRFLEFNKKTQILIKVLKEDPSSFARKEAAFALGKIGSEEAVPILITTLETDESSNVRSAAAYALGKIGSEEAIPALVNAVESDLEMYVKSHSANSLIEIGTEEAIIALIQLSNNEDWSIVTHAREALRSIKEIPSESKEDFIALAQESRSFVWVVLAGLSLEEIREEDFLRDFIREAEIIERAKIIYNDRNPPQHYYDKKQRYKDLTGVNPIGFIGDLAKYPEFIHQLLIASEKTGLSPEIIAATIEQEGLAKILEPDYASYIGSEVYWTQHLGLDTYVISIEQIQSYGLLEHIDPAELLISTLPAQHGGGYDASLTLNDAVLATAGLLKIRDERLSEDITRHNVELNEFERDWYLYLYYNLGPGNEQGLAWNEEKQRWDKKARWFLKNRERGSREVYIQAHRDLDAEKARGLWESNFHYNAGRTAGGSALIKELGIFEGETIVAMN